MRPRQILLSGIIQKPDLFDIGQTRFDEDHALEFVHKILRILVFGFPGEG